MNITTSLLVYSSVQDHVPYRSNAVESDNVTMYTWLEQSWNQCVVIHVGPFLECEIRVVILYDSFHKAI